MDWKVIIILKKAFILFIQQTPTIKTGLRADQHKCLPHFACINLTLPLFQKIVVDSKNDPEIWKKTFHSFVELVETKSQTFKIKTSPAILLKIVVQIDEIYFGMYSQRPFKSCSSDTPTKAEN